jgi:hypothetical protein
MLEEGGAAVAAAAGAGATDAKTLNPRIGVAASPTTDPLHSPARPRAEATARVSGAGPHAAAAAGGARDAPAAARMATRVRRDVVGRGRQAPQSVARGLDRPSLFRRPSAAAAGAATLAAV